jgi:hypothetical protein
MLVEKCEMETSLGRRGVYWTIVGRVNKFGVKVWIGFNWLSTVSSGGLLLTQ